MTLDLCLAGYTADLSVRAKPSSLRVAEVHATTLSRLLGTRQADLLSRPDVNELVGALRLQGLRDTSINGVLRVLRAALKLAGLPSPVKMLRETRKIPSILTATDVERLACCAMGEARLAIVLAAHCGLRHQEILHLRPEDLGDRELRVAAREGWTPKSHAERVVPLNERALSALAGFRGFTATDLTVPVRLAFTKAGLYDPDTKPGLHMLRRTFASRLLAAGVDIETVRELGGWADLTTVQRYLASTSELKRAAVEKL